MEAIYIPRLTRAPERTEIVQFNEMIPELETLTPVQGLIRVKHLDNYLQVDAKAETIVTLTCDRCLQQYNFKLVITPSELIWLDESADEVDPFLLDRDIATEDLVETLSPMGYFDPATWIYEQFCLATPLRKLCDSQCQGIEVPATEEPPAAVDRRWAGLSSLKDQLSG